MTSEHSRRASDTAHGNTTLEVIQTPCESVPTCLVLRELGQTVSTLCLEADMLEVFFNLEASYRQQGASNSAVMAFRQLAIFDESMQGDA